MSNWAARVAAGRMIKERFSRWFSFTALCVEKRRHQSFLLRNILLRVRKVGLYRGWSLWVRQTRQAAMQMLKLKHQEELVRTRDSATIDLANRVEQHRASQKHAVVVSIPIVLSSFG